MTPHTKPSFARLLALLLGLLATTSGVADTPPAPVTIEADGAVFDERRGESTYTGNVIITRAGMQIRAHQVTLYNDGKRLQRLLASGEPVRFRLQREGQGDLNGAAQHLEYTLDDERLLLQGQAWVSQGQNRFSGQRIDYDMRRERVIARQAEDGSQRVQVTIQPAASGTDETTP